jgi:hypothetical protein
VVKAEMEKKNESLHSFMARARLSEPLQAKIIDYFDYIKDYFKVKTTQGRPTNERASKQQTARGKGGGRKGREERRGRKTETEKETETETISKDMISSVFFFSFFLSLSVCLSVCLFCALSFSLLVD